MLIVSSIQKQASFRNQNNEIHTAYRIALALHEKKKVLDHLWFTCRDGILGMSNL